MANATPCPLYPRERNRYPLYKRLPWPQGRPWRVRNTVASTEIRSPDRPAYRIRCLSVNERRETDTCVLNSSKKIPFNSLEVSVFRRVRKFAKLEYWLCHVCPSVRPPAWNNWAPTGRILIKILYLGFLKMCQEIQVLLKSDKNNGYFTWRRFHMYDNMSLNYC